MDLEGQEWLAQHAASVLDAVVDSIVTINAAGEIQSFNQATTQMFGYQPEELRGRSLAILMPEPHRSHHQQYVEKYLATAQPKIIGIGRELVAVKKGGATFPIYLAVSPIPGNAHFVGIIRDLSEVKAAESALLEQKEHLAQVGRVTTMGEMTAAIAHEINQPLTAISMYSQALLRLAMKADVDQAKMLDALGKLSEQALRAGEVIERIQRFVQHSEGERDAACINSLLKDTQRLSMGDARMHGLQLKLDLDPAQPQVSCDPVQIQQVVLNLVRNAIDAMFAKHCEHGSELLVYSEQGDGRVEVGVVDSGGGVQANVQQRLFEAFHSTKKDGMGLGLAICKNIIEDHGGELAFRNNPNPGATFYFSLPSEQTPPQAEE